MSSSSGGTTSTTASGEAPMSSKLFGGPTSARLPSSGRNKNPFDLHSLNTSNNPLPSPTTAAGTKSASSAFHLGGTGAFGSFGLKTPKTPGVNGNSNPLDATTAANTIGNSKLTASEVVKGATAKASVPPTVPEVHPLKNTWVVWYRPPGNKFQDYEKSTQRVARFGTVEEYWAVYTHLKRPSALPTVSDYHVFKKGIRPVWEDKENKNGGKWNIRLKKGVADRYWELLLIAMIGEQFGDAGDDLCGAVLSVRGNEDVLSVWTRVDGPSCLKIK